jgi:thioredoxin 1
MTFKQGDLVMRQMLMLLMVPGVLILTAVGWAVNQGSGNTSEAIQVAGSGYPRLLDLGADKCIPCKKMAPILEAMKEEFAGRLQVDFIDVWKHP